MKFDDAFDQLLGHEGGYVDHKDDPGGETNLGITVAVARANGYTGDMRAMPVSFARQVYRKEYWDAIRADDLPPALRMAVFDGAVNSGNAQSIRWLQRAAGAEPDGRIGPQTIALARAAPPDAVLRRMLAERLRFMTNLKVWPSFSRGWARRIADLMTA